MKNSRGVFKKVYPQHPPDCIFSGTYSPLLYVWLLFCDSPLGSLAAVLPSKDILQSCESLLRSLLFFISCHLIFFYHDLARFLFCQLQLTFDKHVFLSFAPIICWWKISARKTTAITLPTRQRARKLQSCS